MIDNVCYVVFIWFKLNMHFSHAYTDGSRVLNYSFKGIKIHKN